VAPFNAEITVLQRLRGDRLGRERERVVQEVMRVHADGVTLVLQGCEEPWVTHERHSARIH
jgi:hypothetical protein